jgi:hypothetical protein
MSATCCQCRQMSCLLDTLANMQCRQVGDMTKDIMSPTGHTMLSANEGLGRHDRLRHSLLRQLDRVLRRCQYTHGRNDDSKNAPQQCHINKMSMILQH